MFTVPRKSQDKRKTMQEPDGEGAEIIPLRGRKCAMCGKPVVQEFRPFCSRRCADLDLGNWLGEVYRAPTDEAAELDDFIPDED